MPHSADATDERPRSGATQLAIDISAERLKALDRLVADAGVETRKELISQALTLMDWAVKHRKKGHALAALDDHARRMYELSLPVLDKLGPRRA